MFKYNPEVAIYAGTFDPITNGHLDILQRALSVFSVVYLAVAAGGPRSAAKTTYFDTDDRVNLAKASVLTSMSKESSDRVIVEKFDGMLVDFAKIKNAKVIIRGLRAVSDYEYESQLAHTNRLLSPEMETIFFVTSGSNSFISSSIVRNIALNGGDISQMFPKEVVDAFKVD
jgi:pantetheine-phosphate adenylyltransferase